MSDEVKDAGLVAMISSILGGNRRSEGVAPPPLAEVPPTAPADAVEAEPSTSDTEAAEAGTASEAAPVAETSEEPREPIATTRDGRRLLTAEAIADLVLGELSKLEKFPSSGVSVTVYGFRNWNAMITFAPFSASFQDATRFRRALPEIVFKLRRFVELEI